jgi:hypothetical protein
MIQAFVVSLYFVRPLQMLTLVHAGSEPDQLLASDALRVAVGGWRFSLQESAIV